MPRSEKRNEYDSPWEDTDEEDEPAEPATQRSLVVAPTSSAGLPSASSGALANANAARLDEAREMLTVVTWNCASAAPAEGFNQNKLQRTLDRLRVELGSEPDALALQETLFKDGKRLEFAKAATPNYRWLSSPSKLPVCEGPGSERNDPGRGNWLLIRKRGPLDGGTAMKALDLPWDDQHRVVAVETAHGLLVNYYGPACCNTAAVDRGDGPRYFATVSRFLEERKDDLLAVVGDLNMIFDSFDLTDNKRRPVETGGDFTKQRGMLKAARLADAWRHHHEHAREYSRQDDKFDGREGKWARVDHVLVPESRVESVAAKIMSEIRPRETGRRSDHIPVCVWIPKLPRGTKRKA